MRLVTDAAGRAHADLPTRSRGDLEIVATARDAAGNEITDRETVWVTSGSFSSETYGYAGLEVVADRASYRPGDTAQVLINVNQPGGYALVTIEGERLFERRVVRLAAKSNLERVFLRPEYLPNVYVSVVTVQGRKFDHQEQELLVSPRQFALNVSVTPDRERAGPKDIVTFTVRAADAAGRPIDAEFSLGLVDEAIYAIAPDSALEGLRTFYGLQHHRVETTYSFPEIYLAEEPKDGGLTEIRNEFPDTANWFPVLRTGPTGVRKVTVRLPDTLTTWRATVRAHTLASQFGSGISRVVASKDLFVRLENPRFLTQRDRSTVGTIVHNDTDRPQRIAVSFGVTGARLLGPSQTILSLPPHESARTDWAVLAEAPGTASFTATAVSGSGPRDGIRKDLPILPHGSESRSGTSVELAGNSATLPLELPTGALPAATACQLSVSASPAAVMLQALDYLHAEDFGTTENTVGWFLPDVTAAMTFRQLGIRDPALEGRLAPSVRRSLARLARLQAPGDGDEAKGAGWGWAAGADEDPFWTAYALYGLVQARAAGFAVDTQLLDRGRKALVRLLPRERDPSNRALICYVLARAGNPPMPVMADLERRLPELQGKVKNYAIALLALALVEAREPARARQVAAQLTRTVKREGDLAYWPEIYDWGFYSCNDNETTAYAMIALIRTDPANPLIDRAARWLIRKRQGAGWASSEDTASVLYALGAYLLREQRAAPPNYTAVASVNGQPAGQVRVTKATMFQPQVLAIPAALLHPGANEVRITRQGTGRLIYGLSLKTWVEGPEEMPAEISGLSVRREYFRQLRLRDIHGRNLEKMVPAGTGWRPGDPVFVRLTVEVRDPARRGECREVILRDPLPAGCEPIDRPTFEDYDYYDGGSSGTTWWNSDERRREVRDREVIFYAAHLRPGKNVFHYRMRPVHPGQYHLLPAVARAAYIPEISGRSAEARVTIQGR